MPPPSEPSLNEFATYRYLASLPKDPAKLLDQVHEISADYYNGKNGDAFWNIGKVFAQNSVPPETAAAFLRAAATIPGLKVLPDSVDGRGRHGYAVTLNIPQGRLEWIFDKKSLTFTGQRKIQPKNPKYAKSGGIVATMTVVQQRIVDRIDTPSGKLE